MDAWVDRQTDRQQDTFLYKAVFTKCDSSTTSLKPGDTFLIILTCAQIIVSLETLIPVQ